MKLSVIGAGSWGSALTELATRREHDVLLWAHDPKVAEAIRETRSNPFYLPRARFTSHVQVTNSLSEAAAFSNTIMMVTPSHYYRKILSELAESLENPVRLISATKGIENVSLKRISEISQEVLGDLLESFATLSGPTFAVEVSRDDPSAAVIASTDAEFATEVQAELSCRSFRIYRSEDVTGVEIAGALKNVIAIAAGVIEGLGFGSNTNAALVTRGLHEMERLGFAFGGEAATFSGLAGMGDLVLTCTGSLSRNRSVGVSLGKGQQLEQILAETRLIAEGVKTCRSAHDLAEREGVDMPIIREMYRILYENESPRNAIDRLMNRSLKPEAQRGR
ncbi:MAG TPA: NAD(P)H-dependent glycerol-3-phosphate dehydrogenase [Thermoanaerobaculia bacterium]|nr:NAD(P)H-dependent glycerol-3-phosphate dehydrogenase [Thermoanaerobaculia bacterium]